MIVERTHYYAKPAHAEKVLEIRQLASRVRVSIGLPAGSIFTNWMSDANDSPDVVWECAFADTKAHEADLAARAASAEFNRVRETMRTNVVRFSRHIMAREACKLDNGMHDCDLFEQSIVPNEITFSSGELDLKGYLYKPKGTGPFPCIIVNHGSSLNQGSLDVSLPALGALFASWGVASFMVHRAGYGNSPGTDWRTDVGVGVEDSQYASLLTDRLDRESRDVIAAAHHLKTLAEIRPGHIGVTGVSFGGINTLLAASQDKIFSCAIDFAGGAMNWGKNSTLRAKMADATRQLSIPVFFIQAQNDFNIGPTEELSVIPNLTPNNVWSRIFPAFGFNTMEGHMFGFRGLDIWQRDVRTFLERFL